MAVFEYKARAGRGDLRKGRIEAPSAQAVAAQLLNGGITPVHITEVQAQTGRPGAGLLQRLTQGDSPDLGALVLFSRQMHTLLKAGVPIIRGIRGLAESTDSPVFSDVLRDIRIDLESGRELSTAMARHDGVFTTLMVSLVRIGENTGQLDIAFARIAQYLELERDTRDRIKSALRYPVIVIVAIAIAITIINILVIPAFADVFERSNVPLPWATVLLVGISNFFVAWWGLLLAIVVGTVGGLLAYVKTEAGRYRWDRLKLKLPIVGSVIHRATLGRFARGFALSMRSGVPLIQALNVVARAVDNEFVGDRILEMRNGIERGDTLLRTAAGTGLFTPLVLQMIAVGEETGAVDDLLDEVAEFYEREVDYDIRNLSAAIEPILVVTVGIMVLILALGVFLPMWDLASGVGLKSK